MLDDVNSRRNDAKAKKLQSGIAGGRRLRDPSILLRLLSDRICD